MKLSVVVFCSFGTDKFDNNWYHTNNFIYFILVKKTWMSKIKTFELKHNHINPLTMIEQVSLSSGVLFLVSIFKSNT